MGEKAQHMARQVRKAIFKIIVVVEHAQRLYIIVQLLHSV